MCISLEKSEDPQKSPLQKVGAFIKEARQARNLSIEDLSDSLRIGQEQLIALESGNEDLLPEKVFVKAMVRRIAEKLSIDTNFIIEELNGRDKLASNIYTQNAEKEKNTKIIRKKKSTFNILIATSALLGILSSCATIKYIENNNNSKEQYSYHNYQKGISL